MFCLHPSIPWNYFYTFQIDASKLTVQYVQCQQSVAMQVGSKEVKFGGDVDNFELQGIVIDNYYFGVSSVSKTGHESVVVFPNDIIRTTFKRN